MRESTKRDVLSEEEIIQLIGVAKDYLEDTQVRNSVLASLHRAIGLILVGDPGQARLVGLTDTEKEAMVAALRKWRMNCDLQDGPTVKN